MVRKTKTMDGNEAAAYISYAFTDVATIYPITPSSAMAENVDVWSSQGRKNIFGQTVRLVEMQSEHGAAGAMHGALETGALATTYTASQGLLLMIPAMYRMAGQLHPGVIHVAARTVGMHAFSIFGDHSDVMGCRQTGFAMLASTSVQEACDLAAVSHLSAIKGRIPFIHFFDGFRTSHEIQKIEILEYDELNKLVDHDAVNAFRKNGLNPERPVLRTTVQNGDTFFQSREACNSYYNNLPNVVENYMGEINKLTGRNYKLFNYYGDENAEHVVIAMGSACDTLMETVDYLNKKGEKVGFVQVHLYRPFSVEHLLREIPKSVKAITVLDRTKESGSTGEPLYADICTAYANRKDTPFILAGRYGLSSKDVTPAQMKAVFYNMNLDSPKKEFTVGIIDDVTNLSLSIENDVYINNEGIVNCKFWGLGSDGTVGANKNSIKIIGENTNQYVQAYFEYDSKKSGGVTKSHLRFGSKEIHSSYYITKADFIACHNPSYMDKYDIVTEVKPGGVFLLNCSWNLEELEDHLPNKVKRLIAKNNIQFYTINATEIAGKIGLGNRTNTVLQAAFFKLSNILPIEKAIEYMKKSIEKSYSKKGEKVLKMNYEAVDQGVATVFKVQVPLNWIGLMDEEKQVDNTLPEYINVVMDKVNSQKGDDLPVSVFAKSPEGNVPVGTSKYEKRGIAVNVPKWISSNCIGCNMCSLVCPHAAIRPFLLTKDEVNSAPLGYEVKNTKGRGFEDYSLRIQIDPLDCTGCGSCQSVCPSKEKSLVMESLESQLPEMDNWYYSLELSDKKNPIDKFSIKGCQYEQPLLEFSGACAGCGETPYMKLATQLFGDRMHIANAIGCTQVWASSSPSFPYTTNKQGHGPVFATSLFENNAEFGLGMYLSVQQQRGRLADKVSELIKKTENKTAKETLVAWLNGFDDSNDTRELSDAVVVSVKNNTENCELCKYIIDNKEHLVKKSMWMFGGDGWAYDIGYGGLDHVLATNADVNILVVDTEVYSNTGGQASKATPIGAIAKFASSGKKMGKKDLGIQAMQYGHVYVASVAMGADPNQVIKALKESEAYKGPSIIIAYAPCINHGIVKGMAYAQEETKLAVDSGYWFLYRYNPTLKEKGKNPFTLDSKEPSVPLEKFLSNEVRYSSLMLHNPDSAKKFIDLAKEQSNQRWHKYKSLSEHNIF